MQWTLVESIREEMHELNALCKLTEEHLKEDPGSFALDLGLRALKGRLDDLRAALGRALTMDGGGS